MKQETWNDMKRVKANVYQMPVFVTRSNGGIMTNAGVNAKN